MTLYEIKESILSAIDNLQIDEETGEILNVSDLDDLNEQFEEKAEGIGCYIKNLLADVDKFKKEEEQLSKRRRAIENKALRLKNYLSSMLQAMGRDKISTPKVALSFRKSNKLELDNEFIEWAKQNRDDLLKYAEPTADKERIKQELKDGGVVKGAFFTTNNNLIIK